MWDMIRPKSPLTLVSKEAVAVFAALFGVAASTLLCGCKGESAPPEGGATNGNTTAPAASKSAKTDLDNIYMLRPKLSKAQIFARYLPEGAKASCEQCLAAADKASNACDYESAAVLATAAIDLDSENPRAYYQRARARLYSPSSDDSAALADLEKVISQSHAITDPWLKSNAYALQARIFDSRSQAKEAVEAMDKAIAIAPSERGFLKARAALLVAHGDNERAVKDYGRWIEMSPADALPRVLRGQLLESMKNYEQALKDYELAGTLQEDKATLSKRDLSLKLRARLLSKLGRHKESIGAISDAIRLGGQRDDELLVLRANEHNALGNFQEAIEDYSKAIDLAPGFSPAALEGRSKAYDALGKHELAVKDKQEAEALREAPAEKQLFEVNN